MVNKIPKIIHYCWFGHNKMPESSRRYINGWKKKCPGYKIICWSEKDFDCKAHTFTRRAYDIKDWAAISDYVRLVVLYKFGGIYVDTDVEILKSLSPLLSNKSFIGQEDRGVINSGLIYGVHPHDINVKALLHFYNKLGNSTKFNARKNDQVYFTTVYFYKLGFKRKNKLQKVNDCTIYPTSYFCPQTRGSHKLRIRLNTYTIHHYQGSWTKGSVTGVKRFDILIGRYLTIIFGPIWFRKYYKKYLRIKHFIKRL